MYSALVQHNGIVYTGTGTLWYMWLTLIDCLVCTPVLVHYSIAVNLYRPISFFFGCGAPYLGVELLAQVPVTRAPVGLIGRDTV